MEGQLKMEWPFEKAFITCLSFCSSVLRKLSFLRDMKSNEFSFLISRNLPAFCSMFFLPGNASTVVMMKRKLKTEHSKEMRANYSSQESAQKTFLHVLGLLNQSSKELLFLPTCPYLSVP